MTTFFSARGVRVRSLASFRLTRAGIFTDRLVLSLPARAVNEPDSALLNDIFAELMAPDLVRSEASALRWCANELHVGHEVHFGDARWKLYLEHPEGFPAQAPGTVFIAWKWTASTGPLRSTYRWIPLAQDETPASALAAVLEYAVADRELGRLLTALPDRNESGSRFDRLIVSEAATRRKWVDVDLSATEASVGDVLGELRAVASALGLESELLDDPTAQIAQHRLARLAAGTGPNGPFVTVFHQAPFAPGRATRRGDS